MILPRLEGGWYVIAAGELRGRPDGVRIMGFANTREGAEAIVRLLFGDKP